MRINRLSKYLLPTMLTTAVLISIVLSASLWLNPSHYKNNVSSSAGTNIKNQLNSKPIYDVYAPTQLMHNDRDGEQHLLINKSINLIGEVKTDVQNIHDLRLQSITGGSKQRYLQMLRRANSYLLNYSSPVSMQIVNEFMNKRFNNFPNATINRIVLPLDDSQHLYLLNDDGYKIYTVTLKKHSLSDLNEMMNTKMKLINFSMKWLNNRPLIYFKKNQEMPQYAYLVNVQQQNYYVIRLLGESQNFNIKHKQGATIYNDQDSKQITFYNNNDVKYIDERPKTIPGNFNQMLFNNYSALISSGISLDNVKFFGYDQKKQIATYRGYVEGFPIFNNVNSGFISMQVVDNSSLRYRFSLASLQIPVPSGVPDVQLPSTADVLRNLKALGYKRSQINGIELGYSWHGSTKTDVLVNLVPTWYIRYGDTWLNYNDIFANK